MCGPTHRYKYPKPPHWEHLVVFQDLPLLIIPWNLASLPQLVFAAVTSLVSVAAFEVSFHTKKAKMKSSVLKGGATSLYADMQTLQNFHVSFYPAQAGTAHILTISLNASDVLCFVSDGHWHGRVSCFLRHSNGKSSQRGSYPLHSVWILLCLSVPRQRNDYRCDGTGTPMAHVLPHSWEERLCLVRWVGVC